MSQEENLVLINQATLDQIVKDTSIEVLPMLIDNYLEESSLRIGNISKAIDSEDIEALEFEAHTLGSTSLAMGASAVGLLARKIEALCLEGSPTEALALSSELVNLTEKSKQALQQVAQQMA